MKNKKRAAIILACLGATLVLSGCGAQPQQTSSLGIVDEQLVITSHPNMAGAQAAMNEEYAKVQNELKDTAALSPDERKEKIDAMRKRLSEKETSQMTPIKSSVDTAVQTVMKKHGMTAVADKNAIVAGGTDITKEVLIEEGLSEQDADAIMQKANPANAPH